MNNFIMLTGIPGCGKSTFAAEYKEYDPNVIIISSDEVRKEIYGDINDQLHNKEVFILIENLIIYNLEHGNDVIFDATNIYKRERRKLLQKLPENVKKTVYAFNTCLNDCIERNANRDRVVPNDVLFRMYSKYKFPTIDEGWDQIIEVK